jgi:ORF6N domain-containing protein
MPLPSQDARPNSATRRRPTGADLALPLGPGAVVSFSVGRVLQGTKSACGPSTSVDLRLDSPADSSGSGRTSTMLRYHPGRLCRLQQERFVDRRAEERFPPDFMFRLSKDEAAALRSQSVRSNAGRGGRRYPPYVFTEQGVASARSLSISRSCGRSSSCGALPPLTRPSSGDSMTSSARLRPSSATTTNSSTRSSRRCGS